MKTPAILAILRGHSAVRRPHRSLLLTAVGVVLLQLYCPAATRDVTSLGARANDDQDDTSAIQKAIEASSPGDTVSLPAGTFLVRNTLRAKTGVKIQGVSFEQTVLKMNPDAQIDCLDLSATRNVELSGFTIDGRASPHTRHGIFAHFGGAHFIHHLRIQNLGGASGSLAIHFTGHSGDPSSGVCDCTIADNTLRNLGVDSAWGGGIRLSWGSSRNQILRNVVDNTGRGGIFANDGSSDLVIRDNVVTRSGRKAEKLGLEVWNHCDRVVIEGNTVDHWLSIGGVAQTAARRNTIREKSGDIAFIGLEIIGQDIVSTDNLVDDGQQIGISVSNDAHNQYQYCAHNTIQNMVQWGAQLQGDKTGARMLYFYKNRFLSTQRGNAAAIYPGADGRGFRFNGNCQYVALDSNEIRGNPAEGIELGGSALDQISIVNCTICGNAMSAVSGDVGADLEWSNNTLTGNGNNRSLSSRGFANRKPVAEFTCPPTAALGQAVSFVNTSSDPDGKIGHVLWDYDDGVPATTLQGSHTYSRTGTYRVTLIVWDNVGRAAIQQRTIIVSDPKQPAVGGLSRPALDVSSSISR